MDTVGRRTLREILEYRADTIPDELFVLFDDIDAGVSSYTFFHRPDNFPESVRNLNRVKFNNYH